MILVSSCSCLCPIHWSSVLSQEWRCIWGSADRRCSTYIWVIMNLIFYQGVAYIRGLTVVMEMRHWGMREHCTTIKFSLLHGQGNVLSFNSLVPGRCVDNFKSVISEKHITDWVLEHFLWNCCQVNVTEHLWWQVSNGSGNGLVPSGTITLANFDPRYMSPDVCPHNIRHH